MSELPHGWHRTILGEIALWGSGGTPSRGKSSYFNGDIPWLKTGELGPKYIRHVQEKISDEGLKNSSAKMFPSGSVAIAMYGATIGKTSILSIYTTTNQACAVAQPLDGALFNEFLYYFLLSVKKKLIDSGKGGAQPNISQGLLRDFPASLPPLNEQHRIVAKIEELFSELEKGVESLKTAKAQLAIYRQSVLKAAFEGRLTESWRHACRLACRQTGQAGKEHDVHGCTSVAGAGCTGATEGELESASELLARIKTEREARYAAQLAEWQQSVTEWETAGGKASGIKKPTKPKNPKALPPLTADELAALPALSEGWGWSKFGNVFAESVLGKMLDKQKNKGDMLPYLRNQNVRWGGFDLSDVSEMRFEQNEYTRYGLEMGDLVVCEGGRARKMCYLAESKS